MEEEVEIEKGFLLNFFEKVFLENHKGATFNISLGGFSLSLI